MEININATTWKGIVTRLEDNLIANKYTCNRKNVINSQLHIFLSFGRMYLYVKPRHYEKRFTIS